MAPSHTDRQSRKPSITIGGNILEPKRIMLLGASMVQETTICHHLETTHDDQLTESERQKLREMVKHALFDIFRMPKPQHQTPTPVGHTEHSDDLAYGIDIRFFEGAPRDEKVLEGSCMTRPGRNIRLEIEGRSFHIPDTDEPSAGRKEWGTCFQDVDAFLFVVSLLSYSQTSPRGTNAMQDSLMLFESISKSSDHRTAPIILLFNNFDPLEQRMKDYPVVNYYPDYRGSLDEAFACRFFAGKFADHDRAGRLTILLTNGVEQDDEDLQSMIDELCPDLFSKALTAIAEAPE